MQILTFKMAATRSYFPDKVLVTPSNVPATFRWNKQNTFGEKCKNVVVYLIILWDLEQSGLFFALHTRTTQGMCTQSMTGTSVTMRTLDLRQRFYYY